MTGFRSGATSPKSGRALLRRAAEIRSQHDTPTVDDWRLSGGEKPHGARSGGGELGGAAAFSGRLSKRGDFVVRDSAERGNSFQPLFEENLRRFAE